jgi:hypothetical protein
MLRIVMLSAVMLSVIMLSVVMLSVIILSVVMPSVVMLSVVAPLIELMPLNISFACPETKGDNPGSNPIKLYYL